MTIDDSTRKAAIKLLRKGLATPSEVANITRRSRQIVGHWAKATDWRTARAEYLRKRLRGAGWRDE